MREGLIDLSWVQYQLLGKGTRDAWIDRPTNAVCNGCVCGSGAEGVCRRWEGRIISQRTSVLLSKRKKR